MLKGATNLSKTRDFSWDILKFDPSQAYQFMPAKLSTFHSKTFKFNYDAQEGWGTLPGGGGGGTQI